MDGLVNKQLQDVFCVKHVVADVSVFSEMMQVLPCGENCENEQGIAKLLI